MSKAPRGFAAMSPDQRRRIAAMGGKAVPAEKRAFAQDRDLAVRAQATRSTKEPSK